MKFLSSTAQERLCKHRHECNPYQLSYGYQTLENGHSYPAAGPIGVDRKALTGLDPRVITMGPDVHDTCCVEKEATVRYKKAADNCYCEAILKTTQR